MIRQARIVVVVIGFCVLAACEASGGATPLQTAAPEVSTTVTVASSDPTWDQTDVTREGLDAYSEYVRFDPAIADFLNDAAVLGEDRLSEHWELLWDGALTVCTEVAAGRHTFESIAEYFDSEGFAGGHSMAQGARRFICPQLDD